MSASSSECYFINPYQDFNPQSNATDKIVRADFWNQYATETALMCIQKLKPTVKYCDGTVYTGNLGLVFMAYKMLRSNRFKKYENDLKKYMVDCVRASEDFLSSASVRGSKEVGFLVGNGGLAIMACLAWRAFGNEANVEKYASAYASSAHICEPVNFLSHGSDELFVGRAGYLW
jgi:hypothetical protein